MMPLGHIGISFLPFLFKENGTWDVRLLVIGAILPDLIDKPLGHLILPENNGRIIAHSLIFSILVFIIALKYRRLMPLSLGVSLHQLLDGMFLETRSALWPFLGGFEATDYELIEWIHALTEPYVIFEEMLGLSIILLVAYRFGLFRPERILMVVRTGKLGPKRSQ